MEIQAAVMKVLSPGAKGHKLFVSGLYDYITKNDYVYKKN